MYLIIKIIGIKYANINDNSHRELIKISSILLYQYYNKWRRNPMLTLDYFG